MRHRSLGSSGMEGLGMVILGVMAVAGAAAWGVAKASGAKKAWLWIPAGPVAFIVAMRMQGAATQRKLSDPAYQAQLEAKWAAEQKRNTESGMQ